MACRLRGPCGMCVCASTMQQLCSGKTPGCKCKDPGLEPWWLHLTTRRTLGACQLQMYGVAVEGSQHHKRPLLSQSTNWFAYMSRHCLH